jgi:tRNA-intron endonuclease
MGSHGKKKHPKSGNCEADPDGEITESELDDEDEDYEEFDQKETVNLPPVEAKIMGNQIISSLNPSSLYYYERHYYGTKEADSIVYNTFEAVILHERNKMTVISDRDHQPMNFKQLVAFAVKLDEKFWMRYQVYRDLRYRGYIVRMGIGNALDFRIYPRGTQLNTDNAKSFICVLPEGYPVKISVLEAISKQSLANRKDLLLAIVDQLGDISYYQMNSFPFKENQKKEPFFAGITPKK